MLVLKFMEPCIRLIPKKKSDGEGGYNTTWQDGECFDAAVVLQNPSEGRRAENEFLRNIYRVTTGKDIQLKHQDVFRRLSDNQIFRVTSNGRDKQTPACASFSFAQVTAEEWELT